MRLDQFDNSDFNRGRPRVVEACWTVVQGLLFSSWVPGSAWRVRLLRLFGAKIGSGVVIKPRVRVKFPWRLVVGDHSWIGESVWIDNLAQVTVGAHCCISQGAYLCTGNHRWDLTSFDLVLCPIRIEDHCWIGAGGLVAPGITCGEGSVLVIGSTATSSLEQWYIHSGMPAKAVKRRPKNEGSIDG